MNTIAIQNMMQFIVQTIKAGVESIEIHVRTRAYIYDNLDP